MNTWTLTVDKDGIVTLPPDLLEATGWREGDYLTYVDNHDGSYCVVKEDLTNFIKNGIINNEQN